jgi:polyhydroxyalkanoate synthase
LTAAVEAEVRTRVGRMLQGIERYRAHPYRRADPERPVLWREGSARLLDCRDPHARARPAKEGAPVLLVPSLINRAYILDLMPDYSLAGFLAARGHSVFLLDWGAPDGEEADFGLDAYIGRLTRALSAVAEHAERPASAVGYCMGGVLALAAALRVPEQVSALAFLATPWDFHAERPEQARALAALLPALELQAARSGTLPVDTLQALFAGLDPTMTLRKFADFATHPQDSAAARRFVALEDWLNDGVPLSAPVLRETIGGWYGRNDPAEGLWQPGGKPVRPAAWKGPSLAVVPAADRIVPPGSAMALAAALPRCRMLQPPVGHIGMVTAGRARECVWLPLADFLAAPEAA